MYIFNKNISLKMVITATFFVYFCCEPINGRPSEALKTADETISYDVEMPVDPSLYNGDLSDKVIRQIQKCDIDQDRMELCMRCAKVTKSQIVYPMCCDNEEKVTGWCRDYIYFGAAPS